MDWLNFLASGFRMCHLWLTREANRLNVALGLGTVFTAWIYGALTGSLALGISLSRGTASAARVFLGGGIGMGLGFVLLFLLLMDGHSIDERFEAEQRSFVERSRKRRIARIERRERRLEASRRAQAEIANAENHMAQPVEQAVMSPRVRRIAAKAPVATCWYCKQSHFRLTQCPYCRMLCAHP
jgi:hypothetical protein